MSPLSHVREESPYRSRRFCHLACEYLALRRWSPDGASRLLPTQSCCTPTAQTHPCPSGTVKSCCTDHRIYRRSTHCRNKRPSEQQHLLLRANIDNQSTSCCSPFAYVTPDVGSDIYSERHTSNPIAPSFLGHAELPRPRCGVPHETGCCIAKTGVRHSAAAAIRAAFEAGRGDDTWSDQVSLI